MLPHTDVVDLVAHADPVRAFNDAAREGRLIGLATSGTSGTTRMIVRSTASWSDSFEEVTRLSGIDERASVWVPGPMHATMNLFARVHARAVGAPVVDEPGGATHAHLTPSALARALDNRVLRSGTVVIAAGDSLPSPVRARAVEAGIGVHHYYGASELSFVAWATDGQTLRPFRGVECRVVNDIIWARSPYVSRGYSEGSSGGALRWDDDGFATVGDRGSLVDGTVSVWGRGEEAITSAGSTVLVSDIEHALRPCATGDLVIVGVPHEAVGEVVVGVVTESADVDVLAQVARATLEPAQRPRRWRLVHHVPCTPAGKVDRQALRRMLTDDSST